MLDQSFRRNTIQRGDALALLQSLEDSCSPLVLFDPQFRELLDKQEYGNEGKLRQQARAALPTMTFDYINACCREIKRVLRPSGYLMRWIDKFGLCSSLHQKLVDEMGYERVDLIAWDSLRIGMGHRARARGDYLLIFQKPPIRAKATWRDHGIPDRWPEKVDRKLHPHIKPIGLITRLIAATTHPGDLVVDPAAGSFTVMQAALALGREFIGCDTVITNSGIQPGEPRW
jgi:site-specific DNA-methyltransferase (adenine-specific)